MMLLKYPDTKTPRRYTDLLDMARALFEQVSSFPLLHRTVVFGPMRKGTDAAPENLAALERASCLLAQTGRYAVLDLVSFQGAVGMIKASYAPESVQQAILDEFTVPLIAHLDGVHFRRNWRSSPGATVEHAAATKQGIPIYYVD